MFISLLFNKLIYFQKTDVTYELVEELQLKTKEYLQPNPTARAKMAAVKGISKLSGQAKASTYPQPEGTLGECMVLYGKKLGDDSYFGKPEFNFIIIICYKKPCIHLLQIYYRVATVYIVH